ncbi:trypsin-like serine protease [Paraglaciecola sp. 2405UD69-4]|uniref:trypsin-like serine protease n=1 Tax=Paraglaciecola sp. 2405UD69-4 TaxID=3391836 RepID=UPI0039C8E368
MKKLPLAVYFLTLFSMSTSAIVLRHDVPKNKYAASWQDFPALAQFYIDGAHGVLVEPTWIITAAHTTFCTNPGSTILVGDKKAIVKQRFVHPGHTPGVSHDIGLLELESPITHVQPAKMYVGNEEVGKVVTFIGAGGTGIGTEGQTVDNYENKGVLRKANNTVEGANGPLLEFIFHQGEKALPLEGIGGGGDSGGPAFIKNGQDYIVLGVSSRGEIGSIIGKYGNHEYYSRLSFFRDWIRKVIFGNKETRAAMALPKLKHLMPGLTEENLPDICADISIPSEQ